MFFGIFSSSCPASHVHDHGTANICYHAHEEVPSSSPALMLELCRHVLVDIIATRRSGTADLSSPSVVSESPQLLDVRII